MRRHPLTTIATRNRPALGAKTANAKANVFITPAPQTIAANPFKTVSPRLRRAKVKVHQAEEDALDEDGVDIELVPEKKDRMCSVRVTRSTLIPQSPSLL
jgi:hypothetical protein